MCNEQTFYLRRSDAFAGDLQRVVAATENEPVSVLVAHRPIAVDPGVLESGPVCFEIALVVLPEAASHPDPRLFDDKLADLIWTYRLTLFIDDVDIHSRAWSRE